MESLDLSLSTSPTPAQLQPVEAAQPPVRHGAPHDHDQWTSKRQRNKDLRIKALNKLATINSTNPPSFMTGNKVALKLSGKSIQQIQNIFTSSSDKRQEGNNTDMHDHVKNDQPLLPSTVVAPKSFANSRKASDKEHKRSPLGVNKYERGMWKKQILDNYLKSKTAMQVAERDSSCRHDHDDGTPKSITMEEDFSSRRSSKRPMVQLDHHDIDDDHANDCVTMLNQSPAPEPNITPRPPPPTKRDIPRTLNLFPEVPELASSSSQHDHQEEDALTLSLFPTYPMNTCI